MTEIPTISTAAITSLQGEPHFVNIKPFSQTTLEQIAMWTKGELIFDESEQVIGVKFKDGELRGSELFSGEEPAHFKKDVSDNNVLFQVNKSDRWLDFVEPLNSAKDNKAPVCSWSAVGSDGHIGPVNIFVLNESTIPKIGEPILRASEMAKALQQPL